MLGWPSPLTFVNGRVITAEGEAPSLRIGRRIHAIGEPPQRGDEVVDLQGRFVLPGLINAHDHLELNHYGLLKRRDRYGNAREWIDDLRPVVGNDAAVRARMRHPLAARLFIGGLKNLLSGVTTVAHHNPRYRELRRRFPVGLVERFGWAHSLAMQAGPVGAHGEPGGNVAARSAATPPDRPFIVHAGEGVDDEAAAEIELLEHASALRSNTVIVHGVAVPPARWHTLFARGVGLVWCPASNLFLFGRTICVPCVLDAAGTPARVCLGSDSRVTGSRDLLDELRVAAASAAPADALLRMVTSNAADVLRLSQAGRIRIGAPADLTIIPAAAAQPADALLRCVRRDVALVMRRGTPLVGDVELAAAFAARRISTKRVEVDGAMKIVETGLGTVIERCPIEEPGVRYVGRG